MNTTKILAVVLIIAGGLGLAYGSFSYVKETHQANIGPVAIYVEDKEIVHIPIWLSIAVIVAGVSILMVRK